MKAPFKFPILLFALALTGCGLFSHNEDSSRATQCSAPQSEGNVSAFSSTLHPSLQRHCSQCHNSVSPQAPGPFADDSADVAFPIAMQYVDFQDPKKSLFVERMNGGHNCSAAGCDELAALFASNIADWASQQASSNPNPSSGCQGGDDSLFVRTSSQEVPYSLTTGAPSTLNFDLAMANPPVPNAIFQVIVRRYTDAGPSDFGSYQIYNPTLAIAPQGGDSNTNVRIRSIALLFDGQINPSFRDWLATDFVVKPRTFSKATAISGWYVVNPSPQIVDWDSAGNDSISFSFRLSKTSSLPTVPEVNPYDCKSLASFATFYNAKSNDCLSCHGNAASPAYSMFPMGGSADATTCQNFKQRADVNNWANSLFYLMPQNLIAGRQHPVTISFSATDQTNIQTWLNNEK